ncbi:MAG: hypothetical protein C4294_20195, partial [Nitrospiraceae bacterium]
VKGSGLGLALAAGLLLYSMTLPWWRIVLHAPQYPKGLQIVVYLTWLEGDVAEIDTLNHYIGMKPIDEDEIVELRLFKPALVARRERCFPTRLRRGTALSSPSAGCPDFGRVP